MQVFLFSYYTKPGILPEVHTNRYLLQILKPLP